MRNNFPKPDKLPPIYSVYEEYMESIVHFGDMSQKELYWIIGEIKVNLVSYGRLKVYVDWVHHILAHLIEQEWANEWLFYDILDLIYEIYPHELFEEYIGFVSDLFHTYMNIIIHPRYWENDDLAIPDWAKPLDTYDPQWNEVNGDMLNASMDFAPNIYLNEIFKNGLNQLLFLMVNIGIYRFVIVSRISKMTLIWICYPKLDTIYYLMNFAYIQDMRIFKLGTWC